MNDSHRPILVIVLIFTILFAAGTIDVVVRRGPDVLSVVSLLVIAMFAFGIVGALREPPK